MRTLAAALSVSVLLLAGCSASLGPEVVEEIPSVAPSAGETSNTDSDALSACELWESELGNSDLFNQRESDYEALVAAKPAGEPASLALFQAREDYRLSLVTYKLKLSSMTTSEATEDVRQLATELLGIAEEHEVALPMNDIYSVLESGSVDRRENLESQLTEACQL